MCSTALWANPLPHTEALDSWVLVAAVAAKLATGEEGPNFNDGFVLPPRLVFELACNLAPGAVSDGFCQMVILYHAADIEAFYADDIVVTNQLRVCFVQVVQLPIGNLSILPGQLDAGLLAVLAVLWFSGQPSLQPGQLLLRCFEPFRVWDFLPICGDDQILDCWPGRLRSRKSLRRLPNRHRLQYEGEDHHSVFTGCRIFGYLF